MIIILRLYLIFMVMLSCLVFAPYLVPTSYAQAVEKLTYANENEILDTADVRGFIWGLPRSIILAEEKATFVEEEDGALFYVDYIRGIKASITYEFEDDKLFRVRIFSEKDYPNPQDRMEDLVKMKRDLDKRFGEPEEENFEWKKDTDKKFPESWGWAVYRGELLITLKWQSATTFVSAYLGASKPYYPVLSVTYEDAKAKKAKMERKAAEDIKILP